MTYNAEKNEIIVETQGQPSKENSQEENNLIYPRTRDGTLNSKDTKNDKTRIVNDKTRIEEMSDQERTEPEGGEGAKAEVEKVNTRGIEGERNKSIAVERTTHIHTAGTMRETIKEFNKEERKKQDRANTKKVKIKEASNEEDIYVEITETTNKRKLTGKQKVESIQENEICKVHKIDILIQIHFL